MHTSSIHTSIHQKQNDEKINLIVGCNYHHHHHHQEDQQSRFVIYFSIQTQKYYHGWNELDEKNPVGLIRQTDIFATFAQLSTQC